MKTILHMSKERNLIAFAFSVFLLLTGNLSAQSSGDYRTSTAGAWGTAGNWQKYNGSSWVTATTSPDNTSGAITVSLAMTIGADVTVDQVTVTTGSITVNSGKTLTLAGDITDNGTITVTGSMNCSSYVVSGTGTFTVSSAGTLLIGNANGIASSGSTGNIQTTTRSFNTAGKYTYNGSVAQSTGTGLPTSPTGTITITNSSSAGVALTSNLTVGSAGSVTVSSGGTLNLGTNVISGAGTFTLSSGGTIIIGSASGITSSGSSGNVQTTTRSFSSSGNYIYTSTTLTQSLGSGLASTITGNLTINNSYSTGVTISSNYIINSPGVLTVNGVLTCGTQTISGTGTFTLASGGTLQTSNTAGITSSGATGTVQTTTRSYSSSGNYAYTGSSNQVCGNGLPTTVNNLTINNSSTGSSVKLTNSCTINGTLTLTNGTLCYNGNTLTISSGKTISRAAGSLSTCGGSGSISLGSPMNVTYTGTSSITVGPEMPTTSTGLATLTINNNVGITLSANITINTQLIMTKGAITLGSYTMTYATGSTLMYNGTAASQTVTNVEWPSTFDKDIIIANTYTTGVILNADKSSYTGNITVPGVFNVSTYAVKGSGTFTLNDGGTFITAWTTGVVSTAGIQLTGGRTWGTAGNYVFNGSSAQVTGTEMPQTINSITITNSSGVSLSQNTLASASVSATPYYCLYLSSGAFSLGANTLSLGGTINQTSGTITGGTTSKIYFTGFTFSATLPTVSGGLSALAVNRSGAVITLGSNLEVFDTLDLWSGTLNLSATTLTLDGSINNSGGSVSGGYQSNITINNSTNTSINIPTITYGLNNLYSDRSSNDVYMGGDLTVSGVFTLNSGDFNINGYTLECKGTMVDNSNQLVGGGSSNITIDSNNVAFSLTGVLSGLNNLTIRRHNGVSLSGDVTVTGLLTLDTGTLSICSHNFEIDGSYVINTGNLKGGANSNLTIGGSTYPFIIPYITNGLGAFTVNNATGVTLGANLTVAHSVNFEAGSIALDIYNLSLLTADGMTGYGPSMYFITNDNPASAGALVQYVNSTSNTFPVGTAYAYTPATVDNSMYSGADSFYVRAASGVLDGATSGSTVSNINDDVNTTWFITAYNSSSDSDVSIGLTWPNADQNAGFDVSNYGISSFNGSNWDVANFSPAYSPATNYYYAERSGIKNFNAFGVGNKNRALPVELLTFNATPVNNQVNVTWSTATEINNDHFELERSSDAKNFEAIAEVKGAGNSSSLKNYEYNDKFPLSGVSYYRLKQVDFNGKFTFSNIATVHFGGANNDINTLSIEPNPFADMMKLQFSTADAGRAQISIMDLTGKVIYTQNSDYAQGNNAITINVENLAAGVYTLQMQYDNNITTRKIVKSGK